MGLVNVTPSLGLFDWQRLSKFYQEQIDKKVSWLGEINCRQFAKEGWAEQLPEFVYFFDLERMKLIAIKSGFKIEVLKYFCYTDIPSVYKTNGTEYVGMVAYKE